MDRLVCLGNKATNVITTDPEGSEVHRFLESHEVGPVVCMSCTAMYGAVREGRAGVNPTVWKRNVVIESESKVQADTYIYIYAHITLENIINVK